MTQDPTSGIGSDDETSFGSGEGMTGTDAEGPADSGADDQGMAGEQDGGADGGAEGALDVLGRRVGVPPFPCVRSPVRCGNELRPVLAIGRNLESHVVCPTRLHIHPPNAAELLRAAEIQREDGLASS